ncbi:MAG: acetyl-CoA decarbonylase/synthase complex subunit delta [Dehalococcoidia bacterium]|nr:acetyl-CoA decarbonylase/synthase complex subunit delta [Dehalococcoidia bacterium]
MAPVELPVEKWTGKIKEVKLGGNGRKSMVIGGETTLPFLKFEGVLPNKPVIAVEVQDAPPKDWPQALVSAYGDALKDPGEWAKKALSFGAEIIYLRLKSAHPEEGNTGAAEAKKAVAKVLEAVDVPVIVIGPEVPEKDNEVLVAASEVGKGQRLALGNCVEKNHRTIAATCIADGHVAIAKTPIEINLAKQLNILLCDVGLSADSIIMDPTTGALGYGLEYTYSVMERLRIAGLMGDGMPSMPMLCDVGEESWRQKESRVTTGVPETWGDPAERAINWEIITAISLLNSGANIITLRHPKTIEFLKNSIAQLTQAG